MYINLWDEFQKKIALNKYIVLLHNKKTILIIIKPVNKTHCIITFIINRKIIYKSKIINNDYMHIYFYDMHMKDFKIYNTTKLLKLEGER
jgi:hypothetical protein